MDELWTRIRSSRYVAGPGTSAAEIDVLCPGDRVSITALAERALRHEVSLLGSGMLALGWPIEWSRDYKSGFSWPTGYARRIAYLDPSNPSDVKFPWELSRLQWLIPASQAYLLSGEERYARGVREVLEGWMLANPYAMSINWAVAMEAALRVLTWTWLFHALGGSVEWGDPGFRSRFLRALYLHGDWIERNLERSDVNGNHYTADAAGLVFVGLFFGEGQAPERWVRLGWAILESEIDRQVFEDGVDFEGSTAYHRLVCELFFLPALYRERQGLDVPKGYRERLAAMARFVVAYSRDDGTSPQWGDADDGRALPLGTQPLSDHRYLIGLVGAGFEIDDLETRSSGPLGEALWLLGPEVARSLAASGRGSDARSAAFRRAGVYVLRSERDHVFVDAGPVGMQGRGGHGHNDCLSFEAVLDGAELVVDPGAYVYTASYEWRNRFRSTAFHNTPVVDSEEQNRFVDPRYLWALQPDAKPSVERWTTGDVDILRASHSGYRRLSDPVSVIRTFVLDKVRHRLVVSDRFRAARAHTVAVAYHLAPATKVTAQTGVVTLDTGSRLFDLYWDPFDRWLPSVREGWVSPSYGVRHSAPVLEFTRVAEFARLTVVITPVGEAGRDESLKWAAEVVAELDQGA